MNIEPTDADSKSKNKTYDLLNRKSMSDHKLKRILGLPAVTFIAIGTTIGGGVFVFTGIVFKITGAGLTVAYTMAVIPVFISMLPLAMRKMME